MKDANNLDCDTSNSASFSFSNWKSDSQHYQTLNALSQSQIWKNDLSSSCLTSSTTNQIGDCRVVLKSSGGQSRTLGYLLSNSDQCSFIFSNVAALSGKTTSTNPFLKLLTQLNSDCKLSFPTACNSLLSFYDQSTSCSMNLDSSDIPNWAIALIILAVLLVLCLVVVIAMTLTRKK